MDHRRLLTGLCILLMAVVAEAGQVPLSIDWNAVEIRAAFPVTGGVPLARGELKDGAKVALMAGNAPVPVQARVLARWPDKSVKWLLLDFQATAGQKDLRLVHGDEARPAVVERPIVAAETDGNVSIDTGVVRLVIRKDGGGFIDELWYGGKRIGDGAGRRMNFMDAIRAASPADYPPGQRYVRNGEIDPSVLKIGRVFLEETGPLRAVAVVDGRYTFRKVGSTITGTNIKGDCPFRLRITAYANHGLLKVEHFFYYEGDGDHDFVRSMGLKVPLPGRAARVRYVGTDGTDGTVIAEGPLAGLHQPDAQAYEVWTSDGAAPSVVGRGRRFEGVMQVRGEAGLSFGIRDFWQNAAKALHADTKAGEATLCFWPPESPPLDFRRHAREWSVGETGEPDDKKATTPAPFAQPNHRLASKGVGKTHHAMVYLHDPATTDEDVLAVYRLFNQRPILWAPAKHYADTLALGAYRERVAGEHEEIEKALDEPIRFWRHSQEHFGWYGFWLYGNVVQGINGFINNGRWEQDFGRWGWANGDSVGRLSYALMLQAVRKCERADLEFAEKYLLNVHDVCSIHTEAYPEHYRNFGYFKGTAHRHGAWPWACPYTGIRGAHPVGAKIHYYLTGEGHSKDILEEITQLVLRRPDGGMGDGPLGPNAQIYLYQWETTGDEAWLNRLRADIKASKMEEAKTGWDVMMKAAFGIYNAMEEYVMLTGDKSFDGLTRQFADAAMPEKMKNHWTWGGYYRVYAAAYRMTGDEKYRKAIEEMLPKLLDRSGQSAAAKLKEEDWPGKAGGPGVFVDGNIIRDIPFALRALHEKEGQ